MKDILREKSYEFALRIVGLSEHLRHKKQEFVLSRKVLDSGTNIGLFIAKEAKSMLGDCEELQRMLISTLKTTKS